jgi:phosphatidate cytidylyltransferase
LADQPPEKKRFGRLPLRVATGLPLFAAVIALITLAPAWALASLVAGLAAFSMWEYTRLVLPGPWNPRAISGPVLAGCVVLAGLVGPGGVVAVLGLAFLISSLAALRPQIPWDQGLALEARRSWGVLYCGGMFACLFLLTLLPHGRMLLLFEVLTVVAADTGAFFAGHALGRHKLASQLSPGKTVEGGLGGLLLSGLVGAALAWLWLPDTGAVAGAGLGLLCALLSVGGDLLESALKRSVGAKDSGNLLPGHGGLLDRVDGHLLAAPGLLLMRLLFWA